METYKAADGIEYTLTGEPYLSADARTTDQWAHLTVWEAPAVSPDGKPALLCWFFQLPEGEWEADHLPWDTTSPEVVA